MKKFLTAFSYLIFQGQMFANEVQTQGSPYLSEELKTSLNQNVYEPNIFGVILSLLIVLGLIYLTSYFYQKLIKVNAKLAKKDPLLDGKNEFKIISGTTLGQGKFLHVVEINEKYLVLASTASNISLLKEFSKEEIINIKHTEMVNNDEKKN